MTDLTPRPAWWSRSWRMPVPALAAALVVVVSCGSDTTNAARDKPARVTADDAITSCKAELARAAERGPSESVVRSRFYADRDGGDDWTVTGLVTTKDAAGGPYWRQYAVPVTREVVCELTHDAGDWRLTEPITVDGYPVT